MVKAANLRQPLSTAPLRRQKEGLGVGKAKRGKGSKVMAIATKDSRPHSVQVFSATPFETNLVEQAFRHRFSKAKIGKLVGDQAYNSDLLDKQMKRKGVELIAPHKRNRKRKATQDGRKLRPYKKCMTIERFFAWL